MPSYFWFLVLLKNPFKQAMVKLNLDREIADHCRELAESIVHPIYVYINRHSTVSIERAVLRLLGFDGVYEQNGSSFPIANLIVDKIGRRGIKNGIASVIAQIKKRYPRWTQQKMGEKIIRSEVNFEKLEETPQDKMREVLKPWIDSAIRHIDKMRHKKDEKKYKLGNVNAPLKYVVVGTGNVHEDIRYADLAVRQGADVIAVNRSTAQSLLDYVPDGATTEGFGGTFATQENFKLLQKVIEGLSYELGRYVRVCQFSSGLCMPELAVIGATEGIDYLVNDALYGILFRDINTKRSLIDQHFSRMVIARAGITINTSEEHYLKLTDSYLNYQQVLASHFINECLAKKAGVRDDQICLGHAFEIDPKIEDSIILEVARAQLVREIFYRCPIKYMPPTHYKNAEPYQASTLNAIFNVVGIMTGQDIQYLGDLSSINGSKTVQDRYYSIKNANYIFNGCRSVIDEIQFSSNGKIMRHARQVIDSTHKMLKRINEKTLFGAFEDGYFVERPRSRDGGKGYQGIFERSRRYFNPFIELTSQPHGRR